MIACGHVGASLSRPELQLCQNASRQLIDQSGFLVNFCFFFFFLTGIVPRVPMVPRTGMVIRAPMHRQGFVTSTSFVLYFRR